ncbi:MAG: hypothetical protein IKY59_04725 [Oscillospiraceae bacterium]|nr:hypothetical protein [Oscillospiraceae bacterium]
MDRFLFAILTDPLGLPLQAIWEYAILAAIGLAVCAVGWELSCGSVIGLLKHWTLRLLVFLAFWAVAYALLAAVQWVIAHLMLVCSIVALGAIVMFLASATKLYFL